jgi:hypothetical protein
VGAPQNIEPDKKIDAPDPEHGTEISPVIIPSISMRTFTYLPLSTNLSTHPKP